jgi:uncharacterized membrane protein
MRKQTSLEKSKLFLGLALIATGLIVIAAGLLLPRLVDTLNFNPRLIPAAGVVLLGVGFAQLVQYATIRLVPQAARQMLIDNRDERSRQIRARAGNRAFWVSIIMAYIVLLWVSLASSGNIPPLSEDALTIFLVATVVAPMIVYIVGLLYEQINN